MARKPKPKAEDASMKIIREALVELKGAYRISRDRHVNTSLERVITLIESALPPTTE